MGRKILIFGNFPFNFPNEFIDTNHLALYFARNGDEVDFVTPPAYLADLFVPFLKNRLKTLKNHFASGMRIEENLCQYTPLSFLPVRNNLLLGSDLNLSLFCAGFRLSSLSEKEYDLCITSQGFMLLWTDYVKSGRFIYRYNDILEGFSRHPIKLSEHEKRFITGKNPLILTVNERLSAHLRERYKDYNRIKVLPNGVDTELFRNAEPDRELMKIKKKKIVFSGGIDFWVDVNLLYETAKALSDDSVIVLIGPSYVDIGKLISLPNVVYLGPRRYSEIPSLLKACDIGIIPFRKERLIDFVEKPLKYYEYLAAGLYVIATGLADSEDKNRYFKNIRDHKLFIETIRKTDIISHDERAEISLTAERHSWKNIFLQLELFLKEK